jgi:ELWxxDGT repeat protein
MSVSIAEITASAPSLEGAVAFSPADGPLQGPIGEPLEWNGATWFVADGRLFQSDGTSAGTTKAVGLNVTEPLVLANDRLHFMASEGSGPGEIYRVDAPGGGLARLTDFGSTGDVLDGMLPGSVQGGVFFKCILGGVRRLCRNVKGSYEAFAGLSGEIATTVVGGRMLIVDDSHSLWITDGTSTGTKRVSVTVSTPNPTFVLYKGIAYFGGSGQGLGYELWRSDGTEAGTYLEADIEPGPGSSNPDEMYAAAEGLYFRAKTSAHGTEPWVMRH